LDAAGQWLGISDASDRLARGLADNGAKFFSQAATMGYTILRVVGELLLVLVTAVYLAANPILYRDGVATLFPQGTQRKVIETSTVLAAALRLWFMGQLISMAFVGTLSAIAFSLIGLPIPLGLGAIAGVTNFIPLVGPILGSIPAVLFAFTLDLSTVVWTIAAILVIQQVEGYVVTPLVQREVVFMPPALLLFAIVIFGILFGWLGIILAAPITVATMVVVQKVWVRGVIGEEVKVAGEKGGKR
jgi:predicted PurR-regulated permease PerM